MKQTTLSLPELALVAGTRVVLGVGVGLIIADKLTVEQRRAVGVALTLIGALSTVPLALDVLGRCDASNRPEPAVKPA